MRILLVSGVYPPEIGGPSVQTRQIARELVRRGCSVRVATLPASSPPPKDPGVEVLQLDPGRRGGIHRKLLRVPRLMRQLDRLVREFRPDVIHMQTAGGPLALATGRVARRRGVRSILKYAADSVGEASFRRTPPAGGSASAADRPRVLLLALIRRAVFGSFDLLWATTPVYADRLTRGLGVGPERVLLLDNFVDLKHLSSIGASRAACGAARPERPLRLLSVARLNPLKGVDVCIAALGMLRDLPVRLRIVGSGSAEYEEELRRCAGALGVADRVEFAGPVPNHELGREYEAADLFVLASRSEAFGIVLLEAMAAGLPVVATRVGGIPYVVGDGTASPAAHLVPPGDPHALAEAIRTLAVHPEKRDALARAARARSRDFEFDAAIDVLVAAYRRLAERAPDPSGASSPSPPPRPRR